MSGQHRMSGQQATRATRPRAATRAVARGGWGVLVAVGAVLTAHGLGQYVLVATTPGGRATGILLTGVGLMTLNAAVDGFRRGSRSAWYTTWVTVAVLTALGAHILLGGMRDFAGGHLALAAAALAGQLLAAADHAPAVTDRPSVGQQLRAAYPVGFSYAAGVIGIVAGLQLLGLYVVEFGLPQSGGPLGSANDLTSAPFAVLVIPVAIALGAALRSSRAVVMLSLAVIIAMAALALSGPLLVYGVIDFFPTQVAIGSGSALLLLTWIAVTSRAFGHAPYLSAPARLGRALGVLFMAALLLIAASLPLPLGIAPAADRPRRGIRARRSHLAGDSPVVPAGRQVLGPGVLRRG